MNYLLLEKIKNHPKEYKYLNDNSYWYLLLQRNSKKYSEFLKAYKDNNRTEKLKSASNIIDSIDTANMILKTLK